MKGSWLIILLASLTALLGGMAAGIGFFTNRPSNPYTITTLRGEEVEIYGEGIYAYDSLFFAAGYKGQDAVALFLGVPALIVALLLYQRGSLVGHLLLTGLLGYFLYVYSSVALGVAYNSIFILYIGAFASALFAFIISFNAMLLRLNAIGQFGKMPTRSLFIFMLIAGGITLFAWGAPIIQAMREGVSPARMAHYTTMVTYVIDLAVITPSTFIASYLLYKNQPSGIVLAVPLLTLLLLLTPQIIFSTIFQYRAGVAFETAEIVGPVVGFIILGSASLYFLIRIFSNIPKSV
jgi:hypothetical protein